MVRPSNAEIDGLMQVAREIRDTTDESGYSVDVAVGQHRAFSHSRGPASALERSLVLDAARRGASQAGFGIEDVSGGLDIVTYDDLTLRRYRVKRITVTADGELEAVCGAGSSLIVASPDSIFREEKWVLGFITSGDHTIERLVAAEIVNWRGDGPVRLEFGTVIELTDSQPPRGFVSTDEDLEGFEEDGDAGSADAV